jgi:hypothetical protein
MIRRLSAVVLTALLGLILHTGVAHAQPQTTGSVTGKVTDSTSSTPLGSAQLLLVGTTRGTPSGGRRHGGRLRPLQAV